MGCGLPAFGGRFTGTPNVGRGLCDSAREVRIAGGTPRYAPQGRGNSTTGGAVATTIEPQ